MVPLLVTLLQMRVAWVADRSSRMYKVWRGAQIDRLSILTIQGYSNLTAILFFEILTIRLDRCAMRHQ